MHFPYRSMMVSQKTFAPACIPDSWPSTPLRQTIEESRPVFEGKNVLVTGACGFVGGHLARALHASGAHVTALDNDIRPERNCLLDLTGLRHQIRMFEGDITDRKQMADLVREGRFSYIFHLAAGATTVEKAMTDPYGTIMANTMGFVNLAEAARLMPEAQRPVVIYSSTDKVYGETEVLPYTENHGLGGVGVYDAAKLCADILSATYHKALDVQTIVLRMCNIFGPYDLNTNYRLIPKAMRNIFRDGESPELYMNSIEHFRDYLYVEDAVRAYFHIARNPACYGRVYNLPGTHYSATPDVLRDIVSFIGNLQDEEIENTPHSPLARHRWNRSIRIVPSDPKLITISKQHLDGTRIEIEAGFEPKVSFHKGLEATARFYLWYFNQIEKAHTVATANTVHPNTKIEVEGADSQEAFETVLAEGGVPVQVLKPKTKENDHRSATTQKQESLVTESESERPVSFLLEASLTQ